MTGQIEEEFIFTVLVANDKDFWAHEEDKSL